MIPTSSLLLALASLPLGLSYDGKAPLGTYFGVPGDNVTYDYVIVGGGTAGLTIATRLLEQGAGTVGVIEAGSFAEISNSNISQTPVTANYFSSKGKNDWQPLIDWGYQTTPQRVSERRDVQLGHFD